MSIWLRRRRAVGLPAVAALVTASAVLTAPAANADPAGTKPLYAGLTERPMVRVLDASTAGVLYRTAHPDEGGASPTYVKPAGGTAFRVSTAFSHLSGSMLFTDIGGNGRITYRTIGDTTTHSCVAAQGTEIVFLPTGWLYGDPQFPNMVYKKVTATASGCTTKTVTTIGNAELLAADATGFAVRTWSSSGPDSLKYVAFAAPSSIKTLASQVELFEAVSVSGNAVTWAGSGVYPHNSLKRVSTSGGVVQTVPTNYVISRTAATAGATAFYGCPDYRELTTCVAGTVPAAGGAVSVLPATTGLAGDGSAFYFGRYGDQAAIDQGTSASGPLTRVVNVAKLPPVTYALSLGASRAAYVDSEGTAPQSAHLRSYTKDSRGITLGGTSNPGAVSERGTAVDGRRSAVIKGRDVWLRTEGEADRRIFAGKDRVAIPGTLLDVSGTRVLWVRRAYTGEQCNSISCWDTYYAWAVNVYDVRTSTSRTIFSGSGTTFEPLAALWGPYLAGTNANGSIVRRDLSTGRAVTVRPAGGQVRDLDIWGGYVAWSGWASRGRFEIAYRNVQAGTAIQHRSGPLGNVALTGGHVVYGGETNEIPRPLYEWRLGTTATATITTLAYGFAAHDETLAWTGEGRSARIAPNSSYTDPPKYLGNALGAASFTPNGDGSDDRWTPEFPVSKRLPSCWVTIRSSSGAVVRQLGCATVTGSARVSWDGKLSTGRPASKGTYSWTLTGSDSDGALRWWSGVTKPISGTVTVA